MDGQESDSQHLSTRSATMKPPIARCAIIGLGLIGASAAAALAHAYPDLDIVGVDVDRRTGVVAVERHWAREVFRPSDEDFWDREVALCDVVILACPVHTVEGYLDRLVECGYQGILTDTLSTKSGILAKAAALAPLPFDYIPGHPMTGSERNGIDAAREDMFSGANWILCPDETTAPEHFQILHELVHGMGARVVSLRREDHDRCVAIVSHVPHIVASALVQLASQNADDAQALMRLAAGGFKDTTRIAAGSPQLWAGIAFDNEQALVQGLSDFVAIINRFSDALVDQDRDTLTRLLDEAASVRRSLPAAWVPSTDKLLEVRIPMVNRPGIVAEVTTIASGAGCNIQSIEIEHLSEGNAVLSLILTDEGDVGRLSMKLIEAGFSISFNPITPKENAHV